MSKSLAIAINGFTSATSTGNCFFSSSFCSASMRASSFCFSSSFSRSLSRSSSCFACSSSSVTSSNLAPQAGAFLAVAGYQLAALGAFRFRDLLDDELHPALGAFRRIT
jgi:hypothetical protein